MKIKVSKLHWDAILPTRKHPTDAGLDLYAYTTDTQGFSFISLPYLEFIIIHTGIRIEIPKGYVGQIWPKSRSNFLIGAGIIDEGYQGEILVKLLNVDQQYIQQGDPIAQLVLVPVVTPEVQEVLNAELFTEASDRGETGGILTQAKEFTTTATFVDPDDEDLLSYV